MKGLPRRLRGQSGDEEPTAEDRRNRRFTTARPTAADPSPIYRFLPHLLRERAATAPEDDSRALRAAGETDESATEGVSATEKYGAVGVQVASVLAAAEAAAAEIEAQAAREAEDVRAAAHREGAQIRHEAEAISVDARREAESLVAAAERRAAEIEEAARLRVEDRGRECGLIEERLKELRGAVREATEALEKHLKPEAPDSSTSGKRREKKQVTKRAARPTDA